MEVAAARTIALIKAAELTVGSLIRPAELERRRRLHVERLREIYTDYVNACTAENASYVKVLMTLATHHDVKDAGSNAVTVFDLIPETQDSETTE